MSEHQGGAGAGTPNDLPKGGQDDGREAPKLAPKSADKGVAKGVAKGMAKGVAQGAARGAVKKASPASTKKGTASKPNPPQPTSIQSFIGEPAPMASGAARGAPPNSTMEPSAASGETNRPPAAAAERSVGVGAPAVGSGGGTKRVGLVVGREWSFPPKFIEAVDGRDQGVTAELVKLGDEHMDDPCDYALIVDRISHEVPFYRTYLKHAVLQGTTVVNNPFMWSADDKFFGASLITKLGVASPKTVVLPNREYIPGIVPNESLRNLKYPIDWKALAEYVGMPCILKDAHGGGWKEVYVCHSLDELLHHYDNSGLLTMIVQEFIEWDQFIRCLCIGQEEILPMKYDPRERRYLVEHDHLAPALGDRIVKDATTIVRALGYDMNSIEFAVRDGVPYAIDFMNPAPDMDVYSLTPHYFDWAVEKMADMAIRLAKHPRKQAEQLGWAAMFKASRAG